MVTQWFPKWKWIYCYHKKRSWMSGRCPHYIITHRQQVLCLMPKHCPPNKPSPQVSILCFVKLFGNCSLSGGWCKCSRVRILPRTPRRQRGGRSMVWVEWTLSAGAGAPAYCTLCCAGSCLPRGQVAMNVEFCFLSVSPNEIVWKIYSSAVEKKIRTLFMFSACYWCSTANPKRLQ